DGDVDEYLHDTLLKQEVNEIQTKAFFRSENNDENQNLSYPLYRIRDTKRIQFLLKSFFDLRNDFPNYLIPLVINQTSRMLSQFSNLNKILLFLRSFKSDKEVHPTLSRLAQTNQH